MACRYELSLLVQMSFALKCFVLIPHL